MASKFSEDDFSCPVCFEIFKNPVLLQCGHSVCKLCLEQYWETKGSKECPVCRKRSSLSQLPINFALRNLCETYLRERNQRSSPESETVCSLHSEKLNFFCVNDKEPVCVVCQTSRKHTDHKFRPTDEATTSCKVNLKHS